jgi:hypothetical protein
MACFLLPHPGKVVTTKQEFQGALKDIDEDFIKHLKVCSPSLVIGTGTVLVKFTSKKF